MALRGYKPKGKKAIWLSVKGAKGVRGPLKVEKLKRILPISKQRQEVNAEYVKAARKFVQAASKRGERCPVVMAIDELRNSHRYGYLTSAKLNEVHHMRGRCGILLLDQRHWMAVSKAGHRWLHANIAQAREHGWVAPIGQWNTPDEN